MAGGDEHLLDKVLVPLFHAGDAPPAPLLELIGGGSLPFGIPEVGQRHDAVLLGD